MDETASLFGSNIPEYSVSDIAGAVKRTLEGAFGRVRVRGEIVEFKTYSSGHSYFCLKDGGAKLKSVIWRKSLPTIGLKPESGMEVIATGRITTYADRSEYQFMVDHLEYAGAGALLARIEALRVRLLAEGLFDAAAKRALPMLPALVGVITSPQGAVLHDIVTTITRRFGRRILLWPVPVQGEGAAERIAAAIRGMDRAHTRGLARPDVLIVARGGGSLEDLMAFNEEIVLRAVAACTIPLISAVGHETDTTLIDYVSDRRAPTPTAAAELAVPSRAALVAAAAQTQARLAGGLDRALQQGRLHLQAASRGLPDPVALLGMARQRLDDRAYRLELALPNLLASRRAALARARIPEAPAQIRESRRALEDGANRLRRAPGALVQRRGAALAHTWQSVRAGLQHALRRRQGEGARVLPRLTPAPLAAMLRERHARLDGFAARLESGSPMAVLARGYAIVRDEAGHTVTGARALQAPARLALVFVDGEAAVQVLP